MVHFRALLFRPKTPLQNSNPDSGPSRRRANTGDWPSASTPPRSRSLEPGVARRRTGDWPSTSRSTSRPRGPDSISAASRHRIVRDGPYQSTPDDIVWVRRMLTRGKKLPAELVDPIIDFAEYWAHSTAELNWSVQIAGGNMHGEDVFLLRSCPLGLTNLGDRQNGAFSEDAYSTSPLSPLPHDKDTSVSPEFLASLAKYPTPTLANPARKVVFTIKSRDQGWVGTNHSAKGTYHTSWTWFEAGLERYDGDICNKNKQTAPLSLSGLRPIHPSIKKKDDQDGYTYVHPLHHSPEWEVQRNRIAVKEWQDHVITWSYLDDVSPESEGGKALDNQGRGRATGDGKYVRNLKFGDVITLWGKARFGGWTNRVESVKIDVYWAI